MFDFPSLLCVLENAIYIYYSYLSDIIRRVNINRNNMLKVLRDYITNSDNRNYFSGKHKKHQHKNNIERSRWESTSSFHLLLPITHLASCNFSCAQQKSSRKHNFPISILFINTYFSNVNGYVSFHFSVLYHQHKFYQTGLTEACRYQLFPFVSTWVFCVFYFIFVFICALCPNLQIALGCPFVIVPSVFSNVHYLISYDQCKQNTFI